MDLDKYLKEINEDGAKNKNRLKENQYKGANSFENPILARSNTQNLTAEQKQNGFKKKEIDSRDAKQKDLGDKKIKIERSKTKEPYYREKHNDSVEKYNRKKKDLEKFLGDDEEYQGNRLSKMSMKNRQINEAYNKRLCEEQKVFFISLDVFIIKKKGCVIF